MSVTGEDTNSITLQLSKFALITAKYENNNFRAVLKKSHYRKVGSKTILLKTETDLSLQELTNLHDSLTLVSQFVQLSAPVCSSSQPTKPFVDYGRVQGRN